VLNIFVLPAFKFTVQISTLTLQ